MMMIEPSSVCGHPPEVAKVEPDVKRKGKLRTKSRRQCSMCSNAASVHCRHCRRTFYCSGACCHADKLTHKMICPPWLVFKEEGPLVPPKSSSICIYLPAGTDTPKFVWVSFVWVPPKGKVTHGFEVPDLRPFVDHDTVECFTAEGNAIRSRRPTDDFVELLYRPDATTDGSSRNKTASRITSGMRMFYPWCGSLLAIKRRKITTSSGQEIRCRNMGPGDFRDVVDLLSSFRSGVSMSCKHCNINHKGPDSPLARRLQAIGASSGEEPPDDSLHRQLNNPQADTPCVGGVRINGLRDMHARGRSMYEPVQVPLSDPIWATDVLPALISQLVGYKLRTRRIRPIRGNDEVNMAASFLHLDPCFLGRDPMEHFPPEWQMHCGSILVVFDDQTVDELLPQTVKRLCSFCVDFLKPCMDLYMEDPKDLYLREMIVFTLITPEKYIRYCDDYDNMNGLFQGASDWPKGCCPQREPTEMMECTIQHRRYYGARRRSLRMRARRPGM